MREYLLVFLVALSVTYLLTVVAREVQLRLQIARHWPRHRRIAEEVVHRTVP